VSGRDPRFPLFESLRAIAALTVFAFHAVFFQHLLAGRGSSPYLYQLDVGVTIFFLISGFLLYRPFVRARHAGEPLPGVWPYAARRVLRIVPGYWLALTIIALWLGVGRVFTPRGVVVYYGFLFVYSNHDLVVPLLNGGFGQLWTVCVEVTFYAMLPVWAAALRRVRFRTERDWLMSELVPLLVLAASAVAWQLATLGPQGAGGLARFQSSRNVLPNFLDHFALGMALAVLSVHLGGRRPYAPVRLIARFPAIPWLAALAVFALVGQLNHLFSPKAAEVARHELRGLVALAIVVPAVFGDPSRGLVRRLLARRELLWIGLISYGVYLWHPALMKEVSARDVGLSGPLWALLMLAPTIAVAAASYYGVERHALSLARKITARQADDRSELPPGGQAA
jgi:peptidoglycan/LPS O-acetylase OafA/YrhL